MNRPTLTHITSTLGQNKGGLVKLQLCPIEWLNGDPALNPETLVVDEGITLQPELGLITIYCQAESLDYSEKLKESAAGTYFEATARGIINLDESAKSLQLDTLRLHRLLVIMPDKNNRTRIIGNTGLGMTLKYDMEIEPDTAGKSSYSFTLTALLEHPAPFYTAA